LPINPRRLFLERESPKEEFFRGIENKFDGNIGFGNFNFNPLTQQITEISPTNSSVSFQRLQKAGNFDGQFIVVEYPHSTNSIAAVIKHDLNRIPFGIIKCTLGRINTAQGTFVTMVGDFSIEPTQATNREVLIRYLKVSTNTSRSIALLLLF
jgi:hypothetical protein